MRSRWHESLKLSWRKAMGDEITRFLRKKSYQMKEELGQGACGKTVLLYDDEIDEFFVCKKYSPLSDSDKSQLFENFVREIKLLHQVLHLNVVRIFNYYLYREDVSGFILMEHIKGVNIEEYIKTNPDEINNVFLQVLDGFSYLEGRSILHRDIRPQNILITDDCIVKIIDLGFAKPVLKPEDFGKSISLNWWCDTPREFADNIYDFRTEVYFVGKLFEKIIIDNSIDSFKYEKILRRLCAYEPRDRVSSFTDAIDEARRSLIGEIQFGEPEKEMYRLFSINLCKIIARIRRDAKYKSDLEDIIKNLDEVYRGSMLEENLVDNQKVIRCFIQGSYFYKKAELFSVAYLEKFIKLLKSISQEKQRVVLNNLYNKIDSIMRYEDPPVDPDEEIPF